MLVFTPRNLQLYWNLLPLSSKSACNVSGLGRSPGEGNGNPYQYSCLENSMNRSLVGCSPQGCKESDTTLFKQKRCLDIQFAGAFIRPTKTRQNAKAEKKNTPPFINLVFTCSLFLPKFDLPSFFIWNTTASYLEYIL